MFSLLKIRRFAFLLLSFTLSTQSMAVASFGACHQVKAALVASLTAGAAPHQHSGGQASAILEHHSHQQSAQPDEGHHAQHAGLGGESSADGDRVKCAACAGCHLCSVVLTNPDVSVDIPALGSTSFPDLSVSRVRNVASGLERPPRA